MKKSGDKWITAHITADQDGSAVFNPREYGAAGEDVQSLVIGWGNDLLSDDGAGRCVALGIRECGIPGVESLDVHQLTPELVDRIRCVSRVVFVDAKPSYQCPGVSIQPVYSEKHEGESSMLPPIGHVGSPEELLRLAGLLYGTEPEAWLVAVPAETFEPGGRLSDTTLSAVREAVNKIQALVSNERSGVNEP